MQITKYEKSDLEIARQEMQARNLPLIANDPSYIAVQSIANRDLMVAKAIDIVMDAMVYKGIVPNPELVEPTARMLIEDLERDYKYVSMEDVAKTLRDELYGRDYSADSRVSAHLLKKVLDDSELGLRQKRNREKGRQELEVKITQQDNERRKQEYQKRVDSGEVERERQKRFNNCYHTWLLTEDFTDPSNEIYDYLVDEKGYEFSKEQISNAKARIPISQTLQEKRGDRTHTLAGLLLGLPGFCSLKKELTVEYFKEKKKNNDK